MITWGTLLLKNIIIEGTENIVEAFLLHIYGLNSVQCQKDCFYLQNLGH